VLWLSLCRWWQTLQHETRLVVAARAVGHSLLLHAAAPFSTLTPTPAPPPSHRSLRPVGGGGGVAAAGPPRVCDQRGHQRRHPRRLQAQVQGGAGVRRGGPDQKGHRGAQSVHLHEGAWVARGAAAAAACRRLAVGSVAVCVRLWL